jgi:hypothetical protein
LAVARDMLRVEIVINAQSGIASEIRRRRESAFEIKPINQANPMNFSIRNRPLTATPLNT